MAISYVGGQTASITVASPTTQSITYALTGGSNSTPSNGDLVIVGYGEGAGGDATLSSRISTTGFSLVTELFAADTNNSNLAVFRKFMGATPDTSLVVVGATTSNAAATVNIQVWRNVDTTTPLDPTTTTATGSNSGNVNPAAITPAASGNVIAIFGNSSSAAANTSTFTAGSTAYMTDFRQVARAGGTYRGIGGSGYVTGQSNGVSYDPAAWALATDSTAFAWTAATLALRPSPTLVSVTGVAGTGSVGSVTVTGTSVTTPTGVEATGQVGSVTVSVATNASVSVAGIAATGAVGAATVAGKAIVAPTGLTATGQVGTATAYLNLNVQTTGVSATGQVGSVTVAAKASVSPTGIAGTGHVGAATVVAKARVSVTGVAAAGSIGSITVASSIAVSVTGVAATGQVGPVTISISAVVNLSSVFTTAYVGSVSAYTKTLVFVSGLTAFGYIGSAYIWGKIAPGEDPTYTDLDPSASGYTPIYPSGNQTYDPVVPSSTSGYTTINPGQTADWHKVTT